jgi:hypothetical protein
MELKQVRMGLSVVSCIFVVVCRLWLGVCGKAYAADAYAADAYAADAYAADAYAADAYAADAYAQAACIVLYTSTRFTFSFANASQPFKWDESATPFNSSLQ